MFNKWVLAYSGFPFPITLTLWHMVFCSTVGFLCVRVFKVVKSHNMTARDYCNRVLPIGASAWVAALGAWVVQGMLRTAWPSAFPSACSPALHLRSQRHS